MGSTAYIAAMTEETKLGGMPSLEDWQHWTLNP
jgi:hypothetical protein